MDKIFYISFFKTNNKKNLIKFKKKKILLLSWIYKEFEPPWKANFTALIRLQSIKFIFKKKKVSLD